MRKKDACDNSMSFQECELAILRMFVDKAEENVGKKVVNSPEVKKLIQIVENFIRLKQRICYGGTAINNILPKQDQFYNKETELSDYDFYSPTALEDAKELCDIYVKNGFVEVEGKNGMHEGTYKVFVNFIPVADITYLQKDIYNSIKKEAVQISGILYAPPNFLRMAMYLELSRPAGDVSRWEKVLKRLTLLNKNYPLTAKQCSSINFQRDIENEKTTMEDKKLIYETVKDTFISQGVVFFGGYAISLYSMYMPKHLRKQLQNIPDFDVLSEEPHDTAQIVKERLLSNGVKGVKLKEKPAIGEIIAPHIELLVGDETVAFIYKPIACHSYNVIKMYGQEINIATIDTMLSFYLAFLYANRPYYDKDRILCMSQYLFQVQQENRLKQKGLLKRFSLKCYGHQETFEEIRAKKAEKYQQLKGKTKTREYEEYFLRYRPADKIMEKNSSSSSSSTSGKTKKTKKTTKNKSYKNLSKTKRAKTKKVRRGRGGLLF